VPQKSPSWTSVRRTYPNTNQGGRYPRCLLSGEGQVKGSPFSITERRVPEPASDVSHKPGGRLPLLSARPAVTPATLKTAATSFAAW